MKSTKRAAQILTLAAMTLSATPSFAAQPQGFYTRGFYMGAAVGETDTHISLGDMNAIMRDAFRSQGLNVLTYTSSVDTKDTGVYVFGGYRILRWISVEGGYIDLGKTQYNFAGTVTAPTQQVSATLELENKGVVVNAIGTLPVSDYFDLHARAGFFVINTDITAVVRGSSRIGTDSGSTNSFAIQSGLGAAVNLGKHFSLSADWTHYFDVGNGTDENDDYDSGFDVDTVGVSAIVRF